MLEHCEDSYVFTLFYAMSFMSTIRDYHNNQSRNNIYTEVDLSKTIKYRVKESVSRATLLQTCIYLVDADEYE